MRSTRPPDSQRPSRTPLVLIALLVALVVVLLVLLLRVETSDRHHEEEKTDVAPALTVPGPLTPLTPHA